MAKENIQDASSLLLIKDKEIFKKELIERIDKGYNILGYEINKRDELERIQDEYERWDSYNVILLEESFNIKRCEYVVKYDFYVSEWNVLLPLEYQIKLFKENVSTKISILRSIEDKIPLIKYY